MNMDRDKLALGLTKVAEAIYDNCPYLFHETKDELVEKVKNYYLDSGKSLDEIEVDILNKLDERRIQYAERERRRQEEEVRRREEERRKREEEQKRIEEEERKAREEQLRLFEENIRIASQEGNQFVTEDNKANELNAMFSDTPKVENTHNNVNEKPKELAKTDNNGNKGIVSLFSITLSILLVAAVILIALILNVVLR